MTTTRPPFDAELAPGYAVLAELGLSASITPDGIEMLRKVITEGQHGQTDEELSRGGAIEFRELSVPGPVGAPDISLLICRPAGRENEQLPGFYGIHGGGMIAGNNRVGIDLVLDWVQQHAAMAVSVEYRLAPEHPDPAPVEDCYAGLTWVAAHAEEIGLDPDRLFLVGTSAGGGLSAGLALLARDRGGPRLAGQILCCPMLDDRCQTHSSGMLVGEGVWDGISNDTGWDALLGDRRGGENVSVYAAPARETNLAGLPPAYLDAGSVEVFRDEIVDYATRLWQAGVQAELHVWPGGFHSFEGFVPQAALSQAAVAARTAAVGRMLNR